jgi:hypothetical protein
VGARDDIKRTLSRSLEVGLDWMKSGVSRLTRRWTVEATAGAVQTVASAAQVAMGPVAALAVAAASGATLAGIASYAVLREVGAGPREDRRRALAHVIGCVEAEALCNPLLADAWRFAIGAGRGKPSAEWAGAAARVAAAAALARTIRRHAPKRVLRVAATFELVLIAERAKKAHRLVARAGHHARLFAGSTRLRGDLSE